MTNEYQGLISKTFCDQSIRSVMMIDDEVLTYSDCISALLPEHEFDPQAVQKSQRASAISKFFQNRKILCDIDKNFHTVEVDKIRKCDLLILDYHLEYDDPKPSLLALKKLRDSKHMNLVVIYTSEADLDKVWRQVACSLRGTTDIDSAFSNEENAAAWLDATDGGSEAFPEGCEEIVATGDEIDSFIFNQRFSNNAMRALSEKLQSKTSLFKQPIGEQALDKYNIIKEQKGNSNVEGNNGASKWLRIGNVFISFYKKNTDYNDDPQGIWNCLEKSLHEWNPNYYRLITSEIQNHIEDQNLAMRGYLDNDYVGQASWLWKLKSSKNDDICRAEFAQLCSGISENLLDTLLSDQELWDFSKKVIDHSIQPNSEADISTQSIEAKHQFIAECMEHVSSRIVGKSPQDIAHALNQHISSKKFTRTNITVGTLINSTSNLQDWYLCVSPSCDTVPNQHSTRIAERIEPHRLLKFIHLKPLSVNTALEKATHGKYLFVTDSNNKRVALEALNSTSNQPSIDYGIVHNHDNASIDSAGNVQIQFLGDEDQKTFIVMTQLRESYSARFQILASDYDGRVGVDFFPIQTTEEQAQANAQAIAVASAMTLI